MPRKQSLLYDRINVGLCNNRRFGYICDRCEYAIKDEFLLSSLTIRDIILLIDSLLICEKDENIGINPESILVSCRGAITYKTLPINPNVKLSTTSGLSKCIMDMWMSICPFGYDTTIQQIAMSFKATINNCKDYLSLGCSVRFISDNFTSWSKGSIHLARQNSNNSYAA